MRVLTIDHLQGVSFSLYGSNASDTSPMTKPRNGHISPLHEEPSTCPRAFLRLNAMPVPPSCARYIPLPMNCDDDRFSPPLSTRPPPTRSPCLSSVSLIELLLYHPTLVVQSSTALTALTVLSTAQALALLALLLTFVVCRSARFLSAL